MSEKQSLYLKRFVLEDYRSIRHAEIDFMPGLNIIIGKNGSGKTNFLTGLDNAIGFRFSNYDYFKAKMYLSDIDETSLSIDVKPEKDVAKISLGVTSIENYKVSNKLSIDREFVNKNDLFNLFSTNSNWFVPTTIHFGVKKGVYFLDKPFDIDIGQEDGPNHQKGIQRLIADSWFLYYFSQLLVYGIDFTLKNTPSLTGEDLKKAIVRLSEIIVQPIGASLNSNSPIEKFRLSDSFIISSNGKINLSNLFFEYYVQGNWINYSQLSDGTKRIFTLITEIAIQSQFLKSVVNNDEHFTSKLMQNQLILLEEPELGIHPHQLHQLMTFIKEESENKQIILTTHSPQVLNVLGADDFDRIIICEYDSEKGTQLRHMTDQEKKEAAIYMEEVGFFSDYWLHADFNRI